MATIKSDMENKSFIGSEESKIGGEKKHKIHFALFVFFGSMILTFSLWGAYLQGTSIFEQSVMSYLMLGMGTLFSVAAGLFVWSLETRGSYLQKQVTKRTLELNVKNKELTDKNSEIENFIHIISHDLKAPLVSIQGFASILKEDLKTALTEATSDYLNRIVVNAKQMTTLIKDLLEFSRVGRMEDEKESVDANELFLEILDELRPEIQKKNVVVELLANFPKLWGSRKRLHQVFMNLAGNAVKYIGTPVSPKITISGTCQEDGFYQICVQDNGIGIPKESQEKVFQIFHRFHPNMGVEGTGVGLSIVKKIVEMNGGRVRFESEPGKGTSFFVTLPIYKAAS